MRKIKIANVLFVGFTFIGFILSTSPSATAARVEYDYGYSYVASESVDWGGSYGIDSSVDSLGNSYFLSSYVGTVDFDPTAAQDIRTSNVYDAALTKLSPNGTYLWTKTWHVATGWMSASNVTINNDNIYLVGNFRNTMDMNPGTGTDNFTSMGIDDSFLLKLNADGSYAWAKTWGGTGDDAAYDLVFDSNNNMYISGNYNGTVDFDPGTGTDNHTSNGGYDAALTKLNADTSYGWTKTWGGTGNDDYAYEVITDELNRIYVEGRFTGTVDFDPGAGTDNHTSNGSVDVSITRFNADGSFGWTKTWGNASGDTIMGIATDSNKNLYIAGYFTGTVDFDPGAGTDNHTGAGLSDAYLTKLNADGSYAWAKTWGASSTDEAEDVIVDSSDTVRVVSAFRATVDFDPGTGTDNRVANGSGKDLALTSYTADGTYGSTITWGGTNSESVYGIFIDSADNLYLSGDTLGTSVDLNPYAAEDTHALSGLGDIFLTKLSATVYQNVTGIPSGFKVINPNTGDEATDQSEGIQSSTNAPLQLTTNLGVPIVDVTVDISSDLDWSSVTAGNDTASYKSFVYGLSGAPGIIGTHSLYVPKRPGDNGVIICPDATTLSEVSETCSNKQAYTDSDTNVSSVSIGGIEYWLVSGLTGTGGMSGSVLAANTNTNTLANTGISTTYVSVLAISIVLISTLGFIKIVKQ